MHRSHVLARDRRSTSAQISLRQRLCFWSGFLYYITTAVNAFVAPLPALMMLYVLPNWVKPMNTIWLLGALTLWYFVLPSVMHGGWRIGVLRVQVLYSFAHAVAIAHIVTGRTSEWVATGAADARIMLLADTITRVMRITVLTTQILLWAGLVTGMLTYGLDHTWAMLCFGLLAAYVQIPMLFLPGSARAQGREKAAPITAVAS